jgi:predicted permease
MAESLLLALAGSLAGAALAAWGIKLLNAVPPLRVRGIPISFETRVDATTVAFSIALGLACGVVFGLAPALQLSQVDAQQTLRSGASGMPRARLGRIVMALEVALASTVLIAGGLFLERFLATRYDDPGFRRDGVVLAGYDLSGRNLDAAAVARFPARLLDRLRTVPRLESVAIAAAVPLDIHGLPSRFFSLEGHARDDDAADEALTNTVTPGYFAVMGLPILEGRDFAGLHDEASPRQVVVNQEFVRRFGDGHDVIGRRVTVRNRAYTICGVVKNSVYNAFGEPPAPIIYFSYRDWPSEAGEVHLRPAGGSEAAVIADLRRVLGEIDPDLPLYDVRTLSDHIESNLILRRIPARMFVVLGPLLLLLAASGIYAVVAYAVSLRTAEIGIRLALGASTRRVIAGLMREHLTIVAAGMLAGWLVAFTIVVDILSGGVDPAIFAGVPALLLAVAAAASWWPARRVSAVDPMMALRAE